MLNSHIHLCSYSHLPVLISLQPLVVRRQLRYPSLSTCHKLIDLIVIVITETVVSEYKSIQFYIVIFISAHAHLLISLNYGYSCGPIACMVLWYLLEPKAVDVNWRVADYRQKLIPKLLSLIGDAKDKSLFCRAKEYVQSHEEIVACNQMSLSQTENNCWWNK